MITFIEALIGGLTLSGAYFLIAVGVTVVFGQTRIINFAHGQFLVLSALTSWWLMTNGVPFAPAVIVAILIIAILAFVLDVTLLHRTINTPFAGFMITLGLLIILQQVAVELWGASARQLPSLISGSWDIGGAVIGKQNILILGVAGLTTVGLFALLRRSRVGRAIRASAEDPLAASHVGVNVRRIASLTFIGGSALAALAGGLVALLYPVGPFDGGTYIIKGFAVALLGGLGSVHGAAIAAVIVGVSETLGQAYWAPNWVPAITVGLIIALLVLRPQGLFGRRLFATQSIASFLPATARRVPRPAALTLGLAAAGAFLIPIIIGVSFGTQSLSNFVVAYALQAVAVGLFLRLTGELSFAHGVFWGLGAYAAALSSVHWGWGFWEAIPLGMVVAGGAAVLVGVPLMRLTGLSFVLVGFMLTDSFAIVAGNLRDLTGGSSGLNVFETPALLGLSFDTPVRMFWLMAALLVVVMIASWVIERSRFGERYAALRDNAVLARSLGVQTQRYRFAALVMTAMLSGFAGVVFMYHNLTVAPSLFTGFATVIFPLMVILGGARTATGPIVGAVLIVFLPEWLNLGPGATQVAYGVALIVVMSALRQGVVPGALNALGAVNERLTTRRGRRTMPDGSSEAAMPASEASSNGASDQKAQPVYESKRSTET